MTVHSTAAERSRAPSHGEPQGRVVGLVRGMLLCGCEARPIVQLILVMRFATAAALCSGPGVLSHERVLQAGIAWVLANSAIYLFNGICDVVPDRINGKGRPLANGRLSLPMARAVCALLASCALVVASQVGLINLALTAGLMTAGVLYSWTPHRLMRNPYFPLVLILFAGMATYLTGALAAGAGLRPSVVLLAVTMSLWMALVGGVLKDLADIGGDSAAGRRTLATVVGRSRAAAVGSWSAVTLGVSFLIGALLHSDAVLVVPGTVLLISASVIAVQCRRLATGRDQYNTRGPYRVFMLGQYGVHVGVLAGIAGAAL